jgi:hypothetical protein
MPVTLGQPGIVSPSFLRIPAQKTPISSYDNTVIFGLQLSKSYYEVPRV